MPSSTLRGGRRWEAEAELHRPLQIQTPGPQVSDSIPRSGPGVCILIKGPSLKPTAEQGPEDSSKMESPYKGLRGAGGGVSSPVICMRVGGQRSSGHLETCSLNNSRL